MDLHSAAISSLRIVVVFPHPITTNHWWLQPSELGPSMNSRLPVSAHMVRGKLAAPLLSRQVPWPGRYDADSDTCITRCD